MPRRDASLQSDYSSFVQRAPLLYVKTSACRRGSWLGNPLLPLVPFVVPAIHFLYWNKGA